MEGDLSQDSYRQAKALLGERQGGRKCQVCEEPPILARIGGGQLWSSNRDPHSTVCRFRFSNYPALLQIGAPKVSRLNSSPEAQLL